MENRKLSPAEKLREAITSNNLTIITRILALYKKTEEKIALIKEMDDQGLNALHHAILSSTPATLERLLSHLPETHCARLFEMKTKDILHGQNGYHLAIIRGDLEILNVLLKRNRDSSSFFAIDSAFGERVITKAIEQNRITMLITLNKYYYSDDAHKNEKIVSDNILLNYLNRLSINSIYTPDSNGKSPLAIAFEINSPVMDSFIEKLAAIKDHEKIKQIINEHPYLISHAIMHDKNKVLDTFLNEAIAFDADIINHENKMQHMSPIHIAAADGNTHALNLLLKQKNIDIEKKRDNGETALHAAAKSNQLESVHTLMQHEPKPDIDAKTNSGKTALHLAIEAGNIDMIIALLKYGSDYTVAVGTQSENKAITLLCENEKLELGQVRSILHSILDDHYNEMNPNPHSQFSAIDPIKLLKAALINEPVPEQIAEAFNKLKNSTSITSDPTLKAIYKFIQDRILAEPMLTPRQKG